MFFERLFNFIRSRTHRYIIDHDELSVCSDNCPDGKFYYSAVSVVSTLFSCPDRSKQQKPNTLICKLIKKKKLIKYNYLYNITQCFLLNLFDHITVKTYYRCYNLHMNCFVFYQAFVVH